MICCRPSAGGRRSTTRRSRATSRPAARRAAAACPPAGAFDDCLTPSVAASIAIAFCETPSLATVARAARGGDRLAHPAERLRRHAARAGQRVDEAVRRHVDRAERVLLADLRERRVVLVVLRHVSTPSPLTVSTTVPEAALGARDEVVADDADGGVVVEAVVHVVVGLVLAAFGLLVDELLGLLVVRGRHDGGADRVGAGERCEEQAGVVAQPRLDVVLERDLVLARLELPRRSSRPGRRS